MLNYSDMERLGSGYHLEKNNFSFAVCHITLLSTALECSDRWYRAISKGNRKTLQDFSFLCMNISLQHTVTLNLKSPQEQISPETEKFHATCTQKPTPLYTLFTLSMHQNESEQPSLPHCFYNVHMEYHWGSWSCRQLLHCIFCHHEKGCCLVLSAQGAVYHCLLVMTVLQT